MPLTQLGFSQLRPAAFITSGAAPAKNRNMNTSAVTMKYATYFAAMSMCMKFLTTRYALMIAMPNAVIRVTTLMPMNGPATLTISSPSRTAQIFT